MTRAIAILSATNLVDLSVSPLFETGCVFLASYCSGAVSYQFSPCNGSPTLLSEFIESDFLDFFWRRMSIVLKALDAKPLYEFVPELRAGNGYIPQISLVNLLVCHLYRGEVPNE